MIGPIIGIYGASGFGREVAPMVSSNAKEGGAQVVFIDDNADAASSVNGRKIYSWPQFLALDATDKSVVIAIADAHIRSLLADRCREQMIRSFDVVATNVFVGDDVAIGEGHILQPFVTLTSNIGIGRYFHANIYSYVAHDCKIGDFVTFAPGVMCNGNVHIADRAYIGTGAVLKQGTPEKPLIVGAGATVGMGAVVTKDVPPGVTVVGNPARILEKN
jgi:sugar O-acyltransferase (sialic acid O-acetyltransferase NeuD family)